MKNLVKLISLFFFIPLSTLHSCKKDQTTPPILSTTEPTEITQTTVTSGGNIKSDGSDEIIIAGICWSTSPNPSVKDIHTNDAKELGIFTSKLTGLTPDTKYYIRAYASNKTDIGYGNEVTFTTIPIALATLSTAKIESITSTTAVCGGNITFNGGGDIMERGICWSIHENPTTANDRTSDGTGTGSFTSDIKCLSFATTYFVRAYAKNNAGTAYGNQESFTTSGTNPIIFNPELTYGSVTDIDGNCYKTIQIGTQTWMAENLKTSRYNDGTPIPNVTDNTQWENLLSSIYNPPYITTGAYCWYSNDSATYENEYGKLYNYGVINSGKICPVGWHIPPWIDHLDGDPLSSDCVDNWYLGGKLMETGSVHWINPYSSCITNETGFTAVPAGKRNSNGTFTGLGYTAYFGIQGFAGIGPFVIFQKVPHSLTYCQSPTLCGIFPTEGLSIRCVKDN